MLDVLLSALLLVSSPYRPLPDDSGAKPRAEETRETHPQASDKGVADLPFARGRRFRTLDDYLAHLERQGAIDLPWWREIRPGVYVNVTSLREIGGAPPETVTRAELMKRYGFSQ